MYLLFIKFDYLLGAWKTR